MNKDLQCGLCSGIPECCINFFDTKWRNMSCDDRDNYFEKVSNEANYIQCPLCIESKNVKRIYSCEEIQRITNLKCEVREEIDKHIAILIKKRSKAKKKYQSHKAR